ncbi:TetR/AcrR family transcriptional regulator [Flindersiella endophytica]
MPAKRRTKDDWTAAALQALREGGLAAVAIEPLAKRLGATKGSAYWHFASREALLRATVERWEQEHTERVIEIVETEQDPVRRLRKLFGLVLTSPDGFAVELALLSATDSTVTPVRERVTERRIDYLARLFADIGFSRAEARRRAVLGYSAYVGYAQLARSTPGALPRTKSAQRAYLDSTIAVLTTE